MKRLIVPLMAFALFTVPTFADHHEKCSCSTECAQKCKEGKHKDCKCKHCECKEHKGKDCACAHKDEEHKK